MQSILHVNCIPKHDSIGNKAKSTELILLAFAVAFADFATLAVTDDTGNRMASFAARKIRFAA